MHQFDRQKFKALLHYVCSVCPPDQVGRTKLNKAAFFSDMKWYLKTGAPLTGEVYLKQSHGPIARHMLSALRELVDEGKLEVKQVDYYGFSKFEYHLRESVDASSFSDDQRQIIDEVAEFVCMKNTARSISDLSHNETWRVAEPGEELPYFLATDLLDAEVDEADVGWGAEEVKKLANKKPRYRAVHPERLGPVCRELQQTRPGPKSAGR